MDDVSEPADSSEPTVRVGALHALMYCERLFYLEEVEELRVADAAVFAGRALHEEIAREEGERIERFTLESGGLGMRGQLDALRRRDGRWIPYEHKRGRPRRDALKKPEAWDSDRIQIGAYAMLLECAVGETVTEGRLRYHKEGVTVRVAVDDALRAEVLAAVARARELRQAVDRPPVTSNDRLCMRCSLAPVCLPEEERLAQEPSWQPVNLSVLDDERESVHVVSYGSRVGRSGEEIVVTPQDGKKTKFPVRTVGHLVIHGGAQVTSQALHLCVEHDVAVSWFTGGGRFIGTLGANGPAVQRRVRQYRALSDEATCLALARRLVLGKVEGQLRYVLRATRQDAAKREVVQESVEGMRRVLRQVTHAPDLATLLGHEGEGAMRYFSAWAGMLDPSVDERLRYMGRSRRPPRDRINALLGFGYALLLKDVTAGLLAVGLEPALGFYHQPRSSAPPLALDLMELFRVPLVDMAVLGSIHRGQWSPEEDFVVTGEKVWLSDSGRRRIIDVYERRKAEEWKHSVVGYSLSYGRMIELEARLLEKEWSGTPGLFARFRLR